MPWKLMTERRDANRILYSLVEERLALTVNGFLSSVCPEQVLLRAVRPGKSESGAGKAKSAGKGSTPQKATPPKSKQKKSATVTS